MTIKLPKQNMMKKTKNKNKLISIFVLLLTKKPYTMKNLTEKQQNILDNLTNEFNILNNPVSSGNFNLIDVSELNNIISEKKRVESENKAKTNALNKMRIEQIEADIIKLRKDLEPIGFVVLKHNDFQGIKIKPREVNMSVFQYRPIGVVIYYDVTYNKLDIVVNRFSSTQNHGNSIEQVMPFIKDNILSMYEGIKIQKNN